MTELASGTRAAWRSLIVPAIFLAAVLVVLVMLGNWQMRRLAWKLDLIATVSERIDAPATPAPGPAAWPDIENEAIDYRHVHLSGHFLPVGDIHVFTALSEPKGRYGGPGYWMMTPFATAGGWIVFVNRGFVPERMKNPAARPGSEAPEGAIEIDGTIRHAEQGSWTTPQAEPDKNIWFLRNPRILGEAAGVPLDKVAPYTIDERATMTPPGGLPQPGETVVTFPNPHLGYALTWYGLAAAATGVFLVFAAGRLRERE